MSTTNVLNGATFLVVMLIIVFVMRHRSRLLAVASGPEARTQRRIYMVFVVLGVGILVVGLLVVLSARRAGVAAFPKPQDEVISQHEMADSARLDSIRIALARDSAAAAARQASTDTTLAGAQLARMGGRVRDAITLYDRAIELDSTNAYAHGYKGYALYRLRRYPEALASMRRGIAIDSSDPWAFYNIALVFAAIGIPDSAAASVKQMLSLDCRMQATARGDPQYRQLRNSDPAVRELLSGPCIPRPG